MDESQRPPVYSDDRNGPLRLLITSQNYHFRAFFRAIPDHGEMFAATAKALVEEAMLKGHEIRITNRWDQVVFHALGTEMIYPTGDPQVLWDSLS